MNDDSFKRLPPSSSLRALLVAARYLSFTKAASELSITQSAISHQIRGLETFWNVKLFERLGRGLQLTSAGKALVPVVGDFFNDLNGTLEALQVVPERHSIKVSTAQSFAAKWLLPRLHTFQEQNPNIDIWVSTLEDLVECQKTPGGDGVDVAIRLTNETFKNMEMTLLMQEEVFPVCSPGFIAQWGEPSEPEDLRHLPLVLRHQARDIPVWEDWFLSVGIEGVALNKGIRYSNSSMAIQMAHQGIGIALARSVHVLDDISHGNLIRLFDFPVRSPLQYYFVCHENQASNPAIRQFQCWVESEAEKTQAVLKIDLLPL